MIIRHTKRFFTMKIFLRKDIEKVGMAGEIIKVSDGYARNFLFPKELAIEITPNNARFYQGKVKWRNLIIINQNKRGKYGKNFHPVL